MDLLKTITTYYIVMIIVFVIIFISIVTIAINSIIISVRLKKIRYKLIDIDYNNKQDINEINNEIRKINQNENKMSYEGETKYTSLFGSKRQ